MFDDLVNQIKAQLYDRARSPLFGAFSIAWLSWNFLTILLFFSDDSITIKIKTLSKLYPTNWAYFCNGILFPLLSAAAFIVIYPYLAKIAFWHWNNQHIKIKKIQQKQEDETPATQEEINVLRKTSLEQQIELQRQIRELSSANNEFKTRELEILAQAEKNKTDLTDCQKIVDKSLKGLESLTNKNKSLEDTIVKMTQEKELIGKNIASDQKKQKASINKQLSFLNSDYKNNSLRNNKDFTKLINDIQTYSVQHSLGEDILHLMFKLASNDGKLRNQELSNLDPNKSKIELDYLINQLKTKNIITTDGFEIYLSANGKQMVVDSGITKILKIISKSA